MRAYRALISARFRMLLQYRAAAIGGIGTQLFFGLAMIMAYEAFYRSSSAAQPMSYRDIVTYVWLGQAFLAMLPWNVDTDLRALIRSGAVAYEMLRPMDLYWAWYCRALALRIAPTLLRAIPVVTLAMLFLGMHLPPTPASAAAWALGMLGSLFLGCAFTMLMNISLLWTISGEGITTLIPALVLVCSGMNIPLPLFPAWAQRILYWLPFRGLIDVPFRLYLGEIPPGEAGPLFLQQMAWTAALILAGRWLLSRGKRRLIVQGG